MKFNSSIGFQVWFRGEIETHCPSKQRSQDLEGSFPSGTTKFAGEGESPNWLQVAGYVPCVSLLN
jgi:hypothetical protein